MKTMNKTKIYQGLIILGLILTMITIARTTYTNSVLAAKLEIAEQPSEIEIQKADLTTLEDKWRAKENYLIKIEEEKQATIIEKLEIEKQIQAKRNEILGN